MDSSYIAWRVVQNTWTKQYQALGRTPSLAVQAFFDARNLFSRGQTIVLYQAKETTTGEYHVCIPSTTCDNLRQTLTKLMQQLDPHLPVPEWPSATCSYMDPIEFPVSDRNAFQRVFKKTKKANATATKLREAHDAWRYAAELARSPGEYVLCSVDIEAWEQDHSILLEIGWTLYDTRTDRYMDQHYLISSYRHLSNGRYVDDQKLRFGFGTSVWCTLPQALAELKKDLDWCVKRDGGFVLVGHGLDSDLKYLRQAKFLWPGRHPGVDDTLDIQQSALITIINTDVLYAASVNDLHNPPSLGRTLSLFGIDHWCLHNAGNDAHYTMVLLKALVEKLDDTTS